MEIEEMVVNGRQLISDQLSANKAQKIEAQKRLQLEPPENGNGWY